MASKTSTDKRPLSESSSVVTPDHKRQNIETVMSDFDEELAEIDSILMNESLSPRTFIDQNYQQLIKQTIMSESIERHINSLIKHEVSRLTVKYEEKISFLTGCVDSLTTMVTDLRKEVDRQQQYSRRSSVRILNHWEERKGENTDDMVVEMAKKHLNLDINKSDIDRSHRVGRPRPRGNPRPVLVKFVSHRTKTALYKARSSLPLRNRECKAKYIHEDLTRTRLGMYRTTLALRSDSLIQDCWTTDGNIFVRTLNTQIKMFDDPDKLREWSNHLRKNPPRRYSSVVSEGTNPKVRS